MTEPPPHLCLPTLRWVAKWLDSDGRIYAREAAIELSRMARQEHQARSLKAMELYHFGVWNRSGHFTHGENGRTLDYNHIGPWQKIDGRLVPKGVHDNVEGATALHYKRVGDSDTVWTAIAFWDFSADKRGGCNTAFFANRELSFAEMCELAAERYPRIWARLNVKPFLVKTFGVEWSAAYDEVVG